MTTEPVNVRAAGRNRTTAIVIVVLMAAVVGIWLISINNRLVSLDERVKTSGAQVETVLQRRYDLIPNLLNTVKGYASHEKGVLEDVTRLRSQWGAAKTIDEKAKASSALEGTLSRLLVVSENYPQLKADQNFRDLQVELSGSENRVAVERERYNEAVREYNTAVRQFPSSVVASMRGLTPSDAYFESASKATTAPKVDFSDGNKG